MVDRPLREIEYRLRCEASLYLLDLPEQAATMREAADEIERLRLFEQYANRDIRYQVEAAIRLQGRARQIQVRGLRSRKRAGALAHADYNCCAICDDKMEYSGFGSETKAKLCPDCIERSAELGHLCVRPEQVVEYLKTLDDAASLTWLHAMGFSPCYYANDLDAYLISRKLVETGLKDVGKWGNRLKPLTEQMT